MPSSSSGVEVSVVTVVVWSMTSVSVMTVFSYLVLVSVVTVWVPSVVTVVGSLVITTVSVVSRVAACVVVYPVTGMTVSMTSVWTTSTVAPSSSVSGMMVWTVAF